MASLNSLSKTLFLVLIGLTSEGFGISYSVDSVQSNVSFEAVGRPSLMKVKGQGGKIQGSIVIDGLTLSGLFRVPLSDFDTGISLRNEHMRDKYLEVQKFPTATVEISQLVLPSDWAQARSLSLDFTGSLNLKAQKKTITGKLKIDGLKKKAEFEFGFKLSDFDVGVPSYMGITIADLVTARGELVAREVSKP